MIYQNPINYDKPPYFSNLRIGIYEIITRFLKELEFPSLDVLDVGCGTGKQAYAYLTKKHLFYYGIDISPEMIRQARQAYNDDLRAQFSIGTVESTGNTRFAIVNCCSVLYHIKPDISKYIEKLCSKVKDSGYLVLETDRPPNRFDRFMARISIWKNLDYELEELNYHYSQYGIKQQLESLDFTIIQSYGIHLLTTLFPFDGTSLNLPKWLVSLYNLIARVDRVIAPNLPRLSSNFLIIARKNVR